MAKATPQILFEELADKLTPPLPQSQIGDAVVVGLVTALVLALIAVLVIKNIKENPYEEFNHPDN